MPSGLLDSRTRYLQVALNSTLEEAQNIIAALPRNRRIIIEAGTPLIKRHGIEAVHYLKSLWSAEPGIDLFSPFIQPETAEVKSFSLFRNVLNAQLARQRQNRALVPKRSFQPRSDFGEPARIPYVVADLKTFDRGATEVDLAADAGASGAIAAGAAPIETLNAFVARCNERNIDAMIDMMNVPVPLAVLSQLKTLPEVVALHRGVDEETFNREKQLPFQEIPRIKGRYDMLVAMAGGDTAREVQRAAFNDVDIVIVWKSFYMHSETTAQIAEEFLKEIK